MSKIKISTPISNQKRIRTSIEKRTIAGIVPRNTSAKANAIKSAPISSTNKKLIASMNLDEMLEASKIAEIGLRGEQIPTVINSPKVKNYVGRVLGLNKNVDTKPIAKRMQQNLTLQIVERNKKTTNALEARRLYHALMKKD